MTTQQIINLAAKHIGGVMKSSAESALADARRCYRKGKYEAAWRWALTSMSYSVGVFHADYKRGASLLEACGLEV